ncbi:formate dehydrogenase FDH3 subunit beta [Photobacterium damselae subsp. piscicida]|nr:formate dehydrogenase FDH3 subunit beta [Photobacterium damselae subsp. piscicida]MDP2569684.1 formate dehydrogenase FDH3 subunit beta [Photobacterium damselae subsp. piscicida]
MARMKFLCDTKRCIECNGCVTACKNANSEAVGWGIQRRRVVTLNDGLPGETSISVACMHCSDAPCMAVCPADCFSQTEDGIVQHNKDLCIGCGYCLFACPFGAPQFPKQQAFAERGKMDKCTYCSGGPNTEPGSEKNAYFTVQTVSLKANCLCVHLCVLLSRYLQVMQKNL